MKFSRILLLSLFISLNMNNTIQADWSFSNLKHNIEKIEETFAKQWHYAAGLFLIPLCIGAYVLVQKYCKNNSDNIVVPEKPSDLTQSSHNFDQNTEQPKILEAQLTTNQPVNLKNEGKEEESKVETNIDSPATKEKNLSNSNLSDSENKLTDSVITIPTTAQNGKNYFHDIQQRQLNTSQKQDNEHLEVIVSLMHYFYDLANKKGQKFEEGAFIIEDTDHKIFNVMFEYVKRIYGENSIYVESATPKTCSAYPRPSSHLEKYYFYTDKMNKQSGWLTTKYIKNPEYTHYGIDVYGTEKLPINGMHHILFGKVDENRTFIRMEDHGLQTTDYVRHTFGFVNSTGRKIWPAYFGSDDGPNLRKERVPKDILNSFKTFIKELKLENEQEIIKKAEGLGISFMVKTLNENVERQENEFIEKLKQQKYDHIENRIGREVILTKADFQ